MNSFMLNALLLLLSTVLTNSQFITLVVFYFSTTQTEGEYNFTYHTFTLGGGGRGGGRHGIDFSLFCQTNEESKIHKHTYCPRMLLGTNVLQRIQVRNIVKKLVSSSSVLYQI